MNYRINVRGSVSDVDTDFKCGFDFTVENGGSVANVGASIQSAIDGMKKFGNPYPNPPHEDE